MTATIETRPVEEAALAESEQQPEKRPEVGCRRCAEVRHGGPACN